MPKPANMSELALPPDSEIGALLERHPGIAAERFGNEEFLIRGGTETDDIFLLLDGSCVVETADAPAERRPGDALAVLQASPDAPVFAGEMAYLGKQPRSAGVRSVMSTTALRLRPEHLDAIIEGFPGLTRVLCRQFAQRLREANVQLQTLRGRLTLHPDQEIMQPGETLCESGAPAERLFQLVDGVLVRTDGGTESTVTPNGGEPCFIEARAYMADGCYSASYRAKDMCILLVHPAEARAAVVRNFPGLMLDLLRE